MLVYLSMFLAYGSGGGDDSDDGDDGGDDGDGAYAMLMFVVDKIL